MEVLMPRHGGGEIGGPDNLDLERHIPKKLAAAMLAATTMLSGCGGASEAGGDPTKSVGRAGQTESATPTPTESTGDDEEFDGFIRRKPSERVDARFPDKIPDAVLTALPSVGVARVLEGSPLSYEDYIYHRRALGPTAHRRDGIYTLGIVSAMAEGVKNCPDEPSAAIVFDGGPEAKVVTDSGGNIKVVGTRVQTISGGLELLDRSDDTETRRGSVSRLDSNSSDMPAGRTPRLIPYKNYPAPGYPVFAVAMDDEKLNAALTNWSINKDVSFLSYMESLNAADVDVVPGLIISWDMAITGEDAPYKRQILYRMGEDGAFGDDGSTGESVMEGDGAVVFDKEGRLVGLVSSEDSGDELDEPYVDTETGGESAEEEPGITSKDLQELVGINLKGVDAVNPSGALPVRYASLTSIYDRDVPDLESRGERQRYCNTWRPS